MVEESDPTEIIPLKRSIRSIAGLGEPVIMDAPRGASTTEQITDGRIVARLEPADPVRVRPPPLPPSVKPSEEIETAGRIYAPSDLQARDTPRRDAREGTREAPAQSREGTRQVPAQSREAPVQSREGTREVPAPSRERESREPIREAPEDPAEASQQGLGPFAALLGEALGLMAAAPEPTASRLPVIGNRVTQPPLAVEELEPDPELLDEVEVPMVDPVQTRSGGKSDAEKEGWLESAYYRPASARLAMRPPSADPHARPVVQAKVEVPSRPSEAPGAPLGPPPIRLDQLKLSDPDRQVRQGAELVLAALEAIDDNKIAAARNHVRLALGYDAGNASYKNLDSYITRLEASRDPSIDMLEKRAAKLEAEGSLSQAVDVLREAISRAEEPQLFERLGLLVGLKQKKLEAGILLLERAVQLRPKSRGYKKSLDRLRKLQAGDQPREDRSKKKRK